MLYIILMCIYGFMFFDNELLLAVHFICILDYGNDVKQKQIQAIFLLEFKRVIKLTNRENSQTSTKYLAQELLTNSGSKSFAKMRALKMNGVLASHWKLTMTNWEHHRS